jgi:hypothetical protein
MLSLGYQKDELPIVAVVIDNSESMGITDANGDRKAAVKTILGDDALKAIEKNNRVEFFKFSDVLQPIGRVPLDSLTFDGSATDLASALETLKKKMIGKNLASVILVTDGQFNLGMNPVSYSATFNVPVFTVGIGNPVEQKDVVISQINNNDIAYVNSKIAVDVSITAFGYKGKQLTVHLVSDNKTLQTKLVSAPDDGSVVNVPFEFQSDKIGMQKFTIRVLPLQGELTEKNNARTFFIKILKNKLSVCLISGSPGSDHSFLYNALMDDPNIRIKSLVENKDASFSELAGKEDVAAKDFDCYIFNNYPTVRSERKLFETFSSDIAANNKPLFLFYGIDFDANKFQSLKSVAPVVFVTDNSLEETSVYCTLSVIGKNSVILKISDDPAQTFQQWAELPPLWIGRTVGVPAEGSDVLARVDMMRAPNTIKFRKDIPLIVSKKTAKHKSIVVMAYGLWKSYFIMAGLGKSSAAYTGFISNAVRWLTTTEDTKPVIVTSSKAIYRNGERILFTGQVYDEQFNPVNHASLKLKITSAKGITDLPMEFSGNGRYEGALSGLEIGDYDYEGEASQNDIVFGKDKGKFAVEDFSIELLNTAMNEKLLKNIATETGGRFCQASEFKDIVNDMNFPPRISDEKKEIELWNKTLLLFIFAGLLTTEWFIRKRHDLL